MIFVEETDARVDWPEISNEAPCKNPEAVRFVEETATRELCPEILSVTPCRNPEAVTFVEETFASAASVEFRVGKVPYPEAVMLVEDTDAKVDCPEILSDTPCRKPETVIFVPEALVKVVP